MGEPVAERRSLMSQAKYHFTKENSSSSSTLVFNSGDILLLRKKVDP
jgi:hypothetical protein